MIASDEEHRPFEVVRAMPLSNGQELEIVLRRELQQACLAGATSDKAQR